MLPRQFCMAKAIECEYAAAEALTGEARERLQTEADDWRIAAEADSNPQPVLDAS